MTISKVLVRVKVRPEEENSIQLLHLEPARAATNFDDNDEIRPQ